MHSKEWNTELKRWREQKCRANRNHNSGICCRAFGFYFIYFFVIVAFLLLVLESGPQNSDNIDFWGPVYGLIDWEINGAYGYMVLGVLLWELFTMAAVIGVVRWPQRGVERDIDPGSIRREAAELVRPSVPAAHFSLRLLFHLCMAGASQFIGVFGRNSRLNP